MEIKFLTGIECQRIMDKWILGVKYEHGFNKVDEYPRNCTDCYDGTGYIREHNVYLTANKSILNAFNSKLKINAGAGVYYSNIHFTGDYEGGINAKFIRVNATYNSIGLSPSLAINYYPIEKLFISLHSGSRLGMSKLKRADTHRIYYTSEFVLTAP